MLRKQSGEGEAIIFFYIVLAVIFFVFIGWLLTYNDYSMMKFFAPKQEQVRHQTFECSVSHTDGLVRELRQIKDQYRTADTAGKAALADTYKHDMDGYTCNEYPLPDDLMAFRSSLQ